MRGWPRAVVALSLVAGAADACTGTLLLVRPAAVLGLLAVPLPGEEIWLRWIGVFVGSVGLAYALPLMPEPLGGRRAVVPVLAWTALVRAAVALFVAVAVATGDLVGGWWPVAASDLAVAALQAGLIAVRPRAGHA